MKHLLKLSMILLACVAVFFVYSFTAHVAPWYIAFISAGSLVSVYLGLAYTPIPQAQQRFAVGISAMAMMIEMLYGVLYVLSVQAPYLFEPPLPLWANLALAALHGAPFTVLLFGVSMFIVHNQVNTQRISSEERIVITLDQQARLLEQIADKQLLRIETHEPARMGNDETEAMNARIATQTSYACPHCGAALRNQYVQAAAHRYGHCEHCKS